MNPTQKKNNSLCFLAFSFMLKSKIKNVKNGLWTELDFDLFIFNVSNLCDQEVGDIYRFAVDKPAANTKRGSSCCPQSNSLDPWQLYTSCFL